MGLEHRGQALWTASLLGRGASPGSGGGGTLGRAGRVEDLGRGSFERCHLSAHILKSPHQGGTSKVLVSRQSSSEEKGVGSHGRWHPVASRGPLPFSRSLWSQNPRREQTSHLTVRQVLGLA